MAAYSQDMLHAGHDVYCISTVTSAAIIDLIPCPFVAAVTRDHGQYLLGGVHDANQNKLNRPLQQLLALSTTIG